MNEQGRHYQRLSCDTSKPALRRCKRVKYLIIKDMIDAGQGRSLTFPYNRRRSNAIAEGTFPCAGAVAGAIFTLQSNEGISNKTLQ